MKALDLHLTMGALCSKGDFRAIKVLYAIGIPLGIPREALNEFRDYCLNLHRIEVKEYVEGQPLELQDLR